MDDSQHIECNNMANGMDRNSVNETNNGQIWAAPSALAEARPVLQRLQQQQQQQQDHDNKSGASGLNGSMIKTIRSHSIADESRYCWVCFATDEDDELAAWVQPCKCSGTTKWVTMASWAILVFAAAIWPSGSLEMARNGRKKAR